MLQGNSDQFKPTSAVPIGNNNAPVTYSFTSNYYSKCDGKIILTRTAEGNGSSSDYMVTDMISIYKYNKADEDFKPVPLVKNKPDMDDSTPAPLTNANHFAQLSFWAGSFHPSPRDGELKTYDCTIKGWRKTTDNLGVPLPEFEDRRKPMNQNGLVTYM